jgi:hypothetical protein
MSGEMNAVKQAIKNYLDNRAKTDELFAVAYAKPHKNIDECFNYILGEARKQGNAVYLPDDVVFGWAVHYYDEDNIKVTGNYSQVHAEVAHTPKVELTEQEKAEAKKIAMERAIEEQRKQLHTKNKKAAQTKENEPIQTSLFDLL